MNNKAIMVILMLSFSFSGAKAQTNNLYAEFLGLGLLGSINYERMVNDNIFARVSYGGFSVETEGYDDNFDIVKTTTSINPLSVGAHYLRGNNWKLEAGAGISYWMISIEGSADSGGDVGGLSVTADGGFLMFYTSFGFRYQKPDGGLVLKAGVSPIIASVEGETGTLPMPHLSLGYAF